MKSPVRATPPGFDPDFDDRAWTDEWLGMPVALVPPLAHPSGYRIVRQSLREVGVFDKQLVLPEPFDCRALLDPDGQLWMSNTPQEHIMMWNNARRTFGRVLVGGLGLGLYPQYAEIGVAGAATSFTVVEKSTVVRDLVEPTLQAALAVPLSVRIEEIEPFLDKAKDEGEMFDTVFLDVWEKLDPIDLPWLNRLRDLSLEVASPGGRVLLWGYGWVLSLFLDACRSLVGLSPVERRRFLSEKTTSDEAQRLLAPVVRGLNDLSGAKENEGQPEAALAWCRRYALAVT